MFETLDIMTFLREEYAKDLERRKKEALGTELEAQIEATLDEFTEFSRNYLAKINQPLNVTYLPVGLGLRLQQGQTIGFIPEQPEAPQMRDEGIHITRPKTIPGMGGIVDTSGIPISGGRR